MTYVITIELDEVAEGDVTDLADTIWEDNAEALDASLGDFRMKITRDGFLVDWKGGE